MRKRRWVLLAVALPVAFVAASLLLVRHHRRLGNPPIAPITFLYVPEYDTRGALSDYPSFWVTNHTDKVLTVRITGVESRNGPAWAPLQHFVPPMKEIYFQTERGRQLELGPHEAAYGELNYGERMVLPTEVPWRIKASVAEKVAGLGSDIEASARLVKLRLRTGNTNIPWHAFGTTHASYRHRSTIFSQEVPPQPAIKEPESQVVPRVQAAGPSTGAAPEAIAAARAAMREKLSQLPPDLEQSKPNSPPENE